MDSIHEVICPLISNDRATAYRLRNVLKNMLKNMQPR